MSPSLFHGLTLVSKVFKKFVSVFGVHKLKAQYVRSLCQQRILFFFKFPTKEKLIPAAPWFKASVCVARSQGCGFQSRLGNGYVSVVSVVCCHLEVSATD